MSLNKNLLDSYETSGRKGERRGRSGAEVAAAADHDGGGERRRASHLPRSRCSHTARRRRRWRRSRRVRRVRRRPQISSRGGTGTDRGTPPPRRCGHRGYAATPPTTTEKARGADGGADGGADDATARASSTSSLMPSVYHPSSSRTAARDVDDDFEDELRRRAEFAEAEAAANRAAADEAMAEVLDACEVNGGDGREYASLPGSLRTPRRTGKFQTRRCEAIQSRRRRRRPLRSSSRRRRGRRG